MTLHGFGRWSTRDVALAEDARQAQGTAEVTAESEWLGGAVMTWEAPGSWANQAVGFGDAPLTDAQLERLVAYYHDRGAPAVVELTAFAHPDLVRGLAQRGFVLDEVGHVLAIATSDIPSGMSASGIQVSVVDRADPVETDAYLRTAAAAFAETDDVVEHDRLSARIVADPHVTSFVARFEGAVAGAGQMSPMQPVAGLFAAGVLPAFRRRGIHQALIYARLDHAREQGCEVAVVESGPGGPTERNGRRAGMAMAYAKVKLVKTRP